MAKYLTMIIMLSIMTSFSMVGAIAHQDDDQYSKSMDLFEAANFSTEVLDTFNRSNGPIGSNWSGQTLGYSISSNSLDVGTNEDIYWNVNSFGIDQEVFITLTSIDPNASEIGLVLKSQSNNSFNSGLIDVLYVPSGDYVQVWTYSNPQGWIQHGANVAATFANGDQFGAIATANGDVEIFRNGLLLGTRNVSTWPQYTNGGYIGLFNLNASTTVLDDFGGGTTSADNIPPQVSITSPQDGGTANNIISISADASDNIGVLGVQFLIDGIEAGFEDTTPPYSYSWDTRTTSNGAHNITARARDLYNTTLSSAITVNVANSSYFQNEILATGFNLPTSIEFLPDDRMLIVELTGTIKILPPPYTQPETTPFLELNLNIGGYDGLQQGIYDLMLDPDFSNNHYYYIFYTTGGQNRYDRLSRFTANPSITGTIPDSEVVLYQDPQVANTEHHGGSINFGNDGKIYFTTGEHFNATDAQLLSSPRGKVHRINPDGSVPTDNPFHDGVGPNWDSVWAYGLRNPFRAYYDTPTGRLLIGDVGGNDYSTAKEEVNLGAAGANYGWPNTEGNCTAPCTSPLYFYPHNGRDASITGGFIYHGIQYPSSYQGSYFFADYGQNWIRRLTFDQNGNVSGVYNFEPADGTTDGPYGDIVFLTEGPDGALYYVDLGYSDDSGTFGVSKIRRIRYIESNQAPIAVASASPTSGPLPLTVNFSSSGSSDPEGSALSYLWTFGDGATSLQANPIHTYTQAGEYTVRLSVSDGENSTLAIPIFISAGNKPNATLLSPVDGSLFVAGEVISFSGDGTDAEDGTLPDSAFTWNIDFLHAEHVHPGIVFSGIKSGTFTIPTDGHDFTGNTRYRIALTIVDSDGLKDVKTAIVYPNKVTLSFDSSPSSLILNIDGIAHITPFIYDTLIGFNHLIDAPNQSPYTFTSWSDGGTQSHSITVPNQDTIFQALFSSPTATFTPTQTFTPTNTATPTLTSTPPPGTGFPTTGILDNFNRSNGPIGSNWSGQTSGYSILSNQLDVGTSEDIYWNGTTFGPDQEVYLTLTSIDPNGSEIGLILKSQSNSSITGMIVAVYNPVPKYVQVWTYAPSQGWQARGNSIPVIFANGDQFGARATTNGNVEIYQNGTLLATRSVTAWPSYAGSGYIGVFPLSASNTVLDDFGGGTVDPAPIATSTPPPQGNEDVLYLSSTSNGNVGGIALNDEDIVTYDSATDTWSLYFDGSDIGITGDVNAFSIMNDGSILLSLDAAVTLNGLGTVDDSDILHFIPTSVGSNTSGTLSFYTIGSNVGLTASGENIDAIDFTPDGRLLVSTGGSYSVPGISGGDEDLIALDSSGSSWTLYFDGSDVGLNESNSEDISGVWIDPTNNQIHLTTVGSFSVVGLDGGGADIFICTPTALGSTTACTFNSYWIGSLQGFSSEIIDGLDISK